MTDPIQRPWDAKSPEAIERDAKIKRGNRRLFIGISAAMGVLILVCVVAYIVTPKSSGGKQVAALDPISAWSACKQEMEGRLKSPSSAEFPSSLDLNFKQSGKNLTTHAYVDSQNGFGAMIRTDFVCVATANGDDFTANVVVP